MSDDSVECHTLSCVAPISAFNVFRAESGVPPPVKSWLQTADEKPFYYPPASSISLQRNEMVMAYKTPVEKLNEGLMHGKRSPPFTHWDTQPQKRFSGVLKHDCRFIQSHYDTHTQLETYTNSHRSPLELRD
ncbi:hypothetical protein ABVT39_020088 [Epinephelus coioides]